MKISNLILFIAIATFASCSSNATEEDQFYESVSSKKEITLSEDENSLLDVINEYRQSIGLNKLIMNPSIYEFAKEHNTYMIENSSISHTNFSLRAEKVKKNTNAKNVAENVARFYHNNTGVLNGWINSPTHKATLEGNFTHTVISITTDVDGKKYYTQLFYN